MKHYYIVEHLYYREPFMVMCENISEAIDKVVEFAKGQGFEDDPGLITKVEKIDFEGEILL